MSTPPSPTLPAALKRRWWGAVFIFGLAVLGGYAVVYTAWHPSRAGHWGLGATGALAYLLGYTRVYLPLNRAHPQGSILPRLGIGNRLTLLRGLLYGLLAGFLVLPPPTGLWAWAPGFLYTVASLTDLLDGWLARRRGETTDLGAKLDVEVDSIGILVAFALGAKFGQLPIYFAAAGGLFYAYRFGLWIWAQRGGHMQTPPPRRWRSVIGGFEVGFLCVMLWPVFAPPYTTAVGTAVLLPVVLSFLWDGLITTGVLDVHSARYQRATDRLSRWGRLHVPAVLRVATVGCTVWYIATHGELDPDASSTLQYALNLVLLLSSGLVATQIGKWFSALGVLVAGALLSLLVSPPSTALIGTVTGSFLLMMILLGNRPDVN